MREQGGTRRLVVVSRYLPDPGGAAGSRLVHAFAEGARELGRDVTVWGWWPGDEPRDLPEWARWEPLPHRALWRVKGRALIRPRGDVATHNWQLPDDAVVLAEDVLSAPAVAGHACSAVTVHYLTELDRPAIGGLRLRDVQDVRSQRRSVRGVTCPTAYSVRVAGALGPRVRAVPAAIAVPDAAVEPSDRPVATCVADWSWPPNGVALARLLDAWPQVRARVPGALLRLAGYGDPGIGTLAGVESLGPVRDTSEVLASASVLAFPCPPTSGPKVKVMEALSLGLPVVTTPAGVEGLAVTTDGYVEVPAEASGAPLADALVRIFRDPAGAAGIGAAGRAQLAASHAPMAAARARLAVMDACLPAR